jgi:predicted PurR-regulated permease PerM
MSKDGRTTEQTNVGAADAHVTPAGTLDWRKLHLWQIQPVRDVLILAGVAGLIYLGYVIRIVTVPLLLALLLAYLFEPLIGWLERRRVMSRGGAVLGIIVLSGLLVVVPVTVGLGFGIVQGVNLAGGIARTSGLVVASVQAETPEARREARAQLPKFVGQAADWLQTLDKDAKEYRKYQRERATLRMERDVAREQYEAELARAEETGVVPPSRPEILDAQDPETEIPQWRAELADGITSLVNWVRANAESLGKSVGQQALGTGAQAVGAAVGAVVKVGTLVFSGFLTAFFFYFLSTGWGKVLEFWSGLIPERRKANWVTLIERMDRVIAGFVRGRLTICAIIGVYLTLAYWFIGAPAPLILGPVVGALFLLPYISALSVPLVMLLMWIEPSSAEWQTNWWWVMGAPVLLHLSCQVLDDYILSPTIQGKNTDLDTPSILFASMAGGALAGVYGLLIAIPVAACMKIVLREVFWPRFAAWAKGKESDFLPISRE